MGNVTITPSKNILSVLFVTLCTVVAGAFAGKLVLDNRILIFLGVGFLVFVFLLYTFYFEGLVLFLLMINDEFFYLLPRLGGQKNYQDALFPVIVCMGALFFINKRPHRRDLTWFVWLFMGLTFLGALQAYFYGQSIVLGLKAAKGFYLVLLYFVFQAKEIDPKRLFHLIIISGIILMLLNNVQFVLHDRIRIFHYDKSLMRVGELRLLVGGFFTMFAPMVAFAMYLDREKKIYLVSFAYLLATVVIQGKGRAVMVGFFAMITVLLYLSGRINFKNMVLIGVPSLVILLWSAPFLERTFIGRIVEMSQTEVAADTGNVGIRKLAYAYYIDAFLKSPILGRGIWNDLVTKNNPENMKHLGLHLSDIGIMQLFFHFGLLGGLWLLSVLAASIPKLKQVREKSLMIYYAISGYLIFGVTTLVTLDKFLSRRTIIYFVLALALIGQNSLQLEEKGDHDHRS